MACCVCFSQGSKTWIALLVPLAALFARISSFQGTLLISIPLSLLVLSTFCLFRQKVLNNSMILQKTPIPDDKSKHLPLQEPGKAVTGDQRETEEEEEEKKATMEGNARNFLLSSSQDLYSESDQYSSTSSEDHSSDAEWPYNNMRQEGSVDCSDDSLSDEESLFEIAIPSGLSLKEYPKFITHKCCQQESLLQKDFLADINEDNLIEIDINMGSIKYCSSF